MHEKEVVAVLISKLDEMCVGWPQDDWDCETNHSISVIKEYLNNLEVK